MKGLEVLVWLLPGVIVRNSVRLDYNENNSYLQESIPSALLSLILYSLSKLLIVYLLPSLEPYHPISYFVIEFNRIFPQENAGTFALSLLLAIVCYCLFKIAISSTPKFPRLLKSFRIFEGLIKIIYQIAARNEREIRLTNTYVRTFEDAVERNLTLLTLEDDRYLLGDVFDFTTDLTDSDKMIQIHPVMVGKKHREDHEGAVQEVLVYNTVYDLNSLLGIDNAEPSPGGNYWVGDKFSRTVPLRNIIAVTDWNFDFTRECLKTGSVRIPLLEELSTEELLTLIDHVRRAKGVSSEDQ